MTDRLAFAPVGPPEASNLVPSGVNRTAPTHSGASSSQRTERSWASHTVIGPFNPAVATSLLSGDHDTV